MEIVIISLNLMFTIACFVLCLLNFLDNEKDPPKPEKKQPILVRTHIKRAPVIIDEVRVEEKNRKA